MKISKVSKFSGKLMGILTLILLAGVIGTGCGANNSAKGAANTADSEKQEDLPTLSLGMLPSIDAIPFIIAHQQGMDTKHGVNLDIQTFKSAKDRDAAFQAGKLEGLSADLVAIAIYNEAGLDVKIASTTFGEFDLLTGADSVHTVEDLKGKTLILSKNTSTEYTVATMLKQAGLTEADVTVTEVPQIPTRLELLKNQKSDAAILPEPFVTMGTAAGLRVLNSTQQAGINPFVLAFPQKTIDAKGEAIRNMYAAYDEAVEYMKSHDQSEYIDVIIKEVGYPEDMKDQIQVPAYVPAYQADAKEVESAFAWAKEKGLLTKPLTAKDVLSDVAFGN